jgi:hypothetical protein
MRDKAKWPEADAQLTPTSRYAGIERPGDTERLEVLDHAIGLAASG